MAVGSGNNEEIFFAALFRYLRSAAIRFLRGVFVRLCGIYFYLL